MIKRLFNLFQSEKPAVANPTRTIRVAVSEEGVTLHPGAGPQRSLAWGSLERVAIQTTMLTASAENVYFCLAGAGEELVIPNGAAGAEELLIWLQRLPDWDGLAAV